MTLEFFITCWLVIAILFLTVGAFRLGYTKNKKTTTTDDSMSLAIFSFGWPFLLLIAVCSGPFVAIYKIGFYMRNRKWKMQENRVKNGLRRYNND